MTNIVFIVQQKKLLDIKRKAKEKQKLSLKEENRPTETNSMITKNIGVSTDFRVAIINMLKKT